MLSEAQKSVLIWFAWFPDAVVAPEYFGCSQADVDDLVADGTVERVDSGPVVWIRLTPAGHAAADEGRRKLSAALQEHGDG